ncbi:hypothetical protein ACHAWO_005814 [Cyclotella atomus]|uniref:Uncharacterized protein n=1 Tax=Cyclotella atomus TaxID=382360 RepID=A0ABD3P0K9_9STRA
MEERLESGFGNRSKMGDIKRDVSVIEDCIFRMKYFESGFVVVEYFTAGFLLSGKKNSGWY